MDTATQALLGATIAQAGFRHRLGGRALWWGAAGGLLPDLDVVAVATHGPFGEMLYHRGFTHSLWFGPVVGPLLGWAVWQHYARRRHRRAERGTPAPPGPDPGAAGARRAWMGLFVLALVTHPLLDVFTVYGTQLFAPFSRERFAVNAVAIIDPLYTTLLLAALVAGRWLSDARRRGVAVAALALSSAYVLYGFAVNARAEESLVRQLEADGMTDVRVRAYPTIFQPYLRRFVARTPDEVAVGLWTDLAPERAVWQSFTPARDPLIDKLRETWEGELFTWFAMDEISARVIRTRDRIVVEIDDLRYGVSGPPDHGMWGIRAAFDHRGRQLGSVVRFSRPRIARSDSLLPALWRGMWGDFSEL